MKFELVMKGMTSGIFDHLGATIRTQERWEEVWEKHRRLSPVKKPAPEIDFGKYMVIWASMGKRSTWGYTIEIVKVEAKDHKIYVTVYETSPPKRAVLKLESSMPFHVVKIPQSYSLIRPSAQGRIKMPVHFVYKQYRRWR